MNFSFPIQLIRSHGTGLQRLAQALLLTGFSASVLATQSNTLTLAQQPLNIPPNSTPNILMVIDTSRSMLRQADDVTQTNGIFDPASKANIAFDAVRGFLPSLVGKANFGVMTYRYQGSDLRILGKDVDVMASPASNGVDRSTTWDPSTGNFGFRLNAYPTGNGGIADATSAPNYSDKRDYAFKPGELIHYRMVVGNLGPQKAIKPRLKISLPPHLLLNGYDTTTKTYRSVKDGNALSQSGLDDEFSQSHAGVPNGGKWSCHSPVDASIKRKSISNPASDPGYDALIDCDTPELNAGETSMVEFYLYGTGLGAGVQGQVFAVISDTQCNTTSDCESLTPANSPTQTRNVTNGSGLNYAYNSSPALSSTVGIATIQPANVVAAPLPGGSTTTYHLVVVNNTASTFPGSITMAAQMDVTNAGTKQARWTINSVQPVTYTPDNCSSKSLGDNACYTVKSGSPWSCSFTQGDSPKVQCVRAAGMPATLHPEDAFNYGEILEVQMQSATDFSANGYQGSFTHQAVVLPTTASDDPNHVIDPAYNGGSFPSGTTYAQLASSMFTCAFYQNLRGPSLQQQQDSFKTGVTLPATIDTYGTDCLANSGGIEVLRNDIYDGSTALPIPSYATYPTPGDGILLKPMQPLTSALASSLTDSTTGLFARNYGTDKLNTLKGGSNAGVLFYNDTPLDGTLATAGQYLLNKTLPDKNNATGLTAAQLQANYPIACGSNNIILITDGNNTYDSNGNRYPDAATANQAAITQAQALKAQGISTYVIALGAGADLDVANSIAAAGGTTKAQSASDTATLTAALAQAAAQIGATTSLSSVTGNSARTPTLLARSTYDWGQWTGDIQPFALRNGSIVSGTSLATLFTASTGTQVTNWAYSSTSSPYVRRNMFMVQRPSIANGDAAAFSKGVMWPASTLSKAASPNNTTPQFYPWQADALNQDASGTTDTNGFNRLKWMRGDTSNEVGNGGLDLFRKRTNILGDVVNSSPVIVSTPNELNTYAVTNSTYPTFKSNYANRLTMIYWGGNDGLLHGAKYVPPEETAALVSTWPFTANQPGIFEQFAVMPSFMMKAIPKLMDKGYLTSHRYFMDATPTVGDLPFACKWTSSTKCSSGSSSWTTLLVAGAGAGGRGYIALDVTEPTLNNAKDYYSTTSPNQFFQGTTSTNTNATKLIKWEFTSENSHSGSVNASGVVSGTVTGDKDLGFTFSQPVLARVMDDVTPKNVVIFGNGYNNTDTTMGSASTTGLAALYIVDADTGALIRKIPVNGVGSPSAPNGLGTPLALDVDRDGLIDRVYAADLYGNVWRFNLYGTDRKAASWVPAFGTLASPTPLFKATDGQGNPRSITGPLKAVYQGTKGYMILFGSGRYLANEDVRSAYDSTDEDALYSIWDRDDSTPITASGAALTDPRKLLINNEVKSCVKPQSVGSNNTTNSCVTAADRTGSNPYLTVGMTDAYKTGSGTTSYCTTQSPSLGGNGLPQCVMGCFIELKNLPMANFNGERSFFSPSVGGGAVQFNTVIPPANLCSPTDKGLTAEYLFNYLTCTAVPYNPYDVNKDGSFTLSDFLLDPNGQAISPAGQLLSGLIPPGARYYSTNGTSTVFEGSSSNAANDATAIQKDSVFLRSSGGRVSWREIQPQTVKP